MNSHVPFDACQPWGNTYGSNCSNDPLVDKLIGNAYHVVRTVYCNLGNLKLIFDFLNQYGMVLGVQSETELKAMTTSASYVRLYGFDNTNKRVVTDYLYVEGDRTGVIPDDPTATGSWILVATTNSGGGGEDDGKASPPYIPYTYNNGSAIGGETTIAVPAGTVGVPMIVVEGYTNLVGYGFTYDATSLTVTLTQPLEPGDEVHLFLTGTPAVPDNPNVTDWVQINWLYNGGYAVGGEQVIAIPYTFESVPAIYKNGERYYAGLADKSYTVDAANQRILLTEPLATNDRLIVTIGGETTTLIMSDRTLQEVARSANVHENEVILSTNTTQYLNGMKVIYDVVEQKIYGLPTLPTNVYINSVSNGQLTYSPGNITVDLLPVPNPVQDNLDAYKADLANASDAAKGDALITVKQPALNTISRSLHLMNADYINIKDWGAKGDGVTDDTDAIDKACAALTGSSFINNFRRIYMPHGTYIYNGTGIVLPNGTSLVGEDLFTVIDASSNTNSGYLIKLTGFRSRVSNLALYGNSANTGLVAISSSYNTNLGGVVDVIIQDFHNGIDIDKCWYAIYRGIQFRRSSGSVVLTGSHIRIGYNLPTEEVNNLDFSCIYLCEQQKHGVAIYCPTQVLSWNQCSFETIGEARIKFYTAANQNTFVLNDCYIEGNVGTSGGVYFVEGQNISQTISTKNCMFRLGSLAGSLGKNITIRDSNSWANCPNITLNRNNTKVWASDYRSFIGGFADGIDPGRSGDYDGSGMYTAAVYMQPRVQDIRDWNSIIPATVNAKVFNTAGQTLNMWTVYLPATTNSQRIMQLTIDASYKRLSGSDQYNTQWVLSLTNNDLTGSVLTRVFENGTTNAGAGSLTLAIVADGYDAATDSAKFTLTITTATTGLVLAKLQGMHAESDTLGVATKRWRIQRR